MGAGLAARQARTALGGSPHPVLGDPAEECSAGSGRRSGKDTCARTGAGTSLGLRYPTLIFGLVGSSGSPARLATLMAACRNHVGRRTSTALALISVLAAVGPPVRAQEAEPVSLEWWQPLAAGAGAAAVMLLDEPVRDRIQPAPESLDGLSDFAARFKDGEVFWLSSAGATALGLALREPKVTVTGLHILTAYGVAGWLNVGTKWIFGRSRPSATPSDAWDFDWLDGGEDSAFPSGSAAVVFSLATTLSDAIDRVPATVALYGGAGLNAWARLHANRHWLSDVAVGALVGVTSAKLVNGEWTIFGLDPPRLWTDGRSSGLVVSVGL